MEITNQLSKPWQKFFDRLKDHQNLKPAYWNEAHLLGYLTFRFHQHYQVPFAFSFQGSPSKCTEMVLIKKMCAMLGTSNPLKIKAFIDWCFDTQIIPKKLKIRTLAYFMTQGLGNQFQFAWNEKNTISKTTELPKDYLEVIVQLDLPVQTYGDLAFVCRSLEENPEDESRLPYRQLLTQLQALGFDPEQLNNI